MYDVIVVGGGNAALCAAISASEVARKILVLERAPEEESGGNSRFTAGLMRVVYNGVEDLKQVIELSADEIARSDFGTYTEEQFFDDMARVTEFRCDPDLTEILEAKPSHGRLDARERHAVYRGMGTAGVQHRRQVQVLGRAHGRSRRRRTGACRLAHPDGAQERRRNPVPRTRRLLGGRRCGRARSWQSMAKRKPCHPARLSWRPAASRRTPSGGRGYLGSG